MIKMASKIRNALIRPVAQTLEIQAAAIGKQLSLQLRELNELDQLSDAGFRVFSQFDEDGIIEWLLQRISISSDRFIEFGVENYTESNTRFLLNNRNWEGLLFDSSQDYIDYIIRDSIYWRHSLSVGCTFVTPDNINDLLKSKGFVGDIGLLSIDAGGQDYWIWKAIEVITPDIVICEYNSVLGDTKPLTVPLITQANAHPTHFSGLYWGANHKAFEMLGAEKGYVMLGSNLGGHNCFLIKKSLFENIGKHIKNRKPRQSRYRDSRDEGGRLTYLSGIQKLSAISHLPVLDLTTGKLEKMSAIDDIYSKNWY